MPHFIAACCVILALLAAGHAAAGESGETRSPIEKLTISRNDEIHECFPSLCRTNTGRLILTYRESDEHQPRRFTNIITRFSDDDGGTWSERNVIVASESKEPNALLKYNCPKVQQLKDGRLLLLCDVFVNDLSKGIDTRFLEGRNVFWFSDDNGDTWSEEPVTSGVGGIMPDEVMELDDGAWLLATHIPNRDDPFVTQYAARSTDGGKTWSGPIAIASREGYRFCEASIVKCADGLLICFMRENSGLGRPAYKCFSEDGGITWSEPYATLMDGNHRPVAHWTKDGRLLVTYRYYPGPGAGMRNTFAYIESEKSAREPERAKQSGRIRPLDYDSHARPDSGYTGWAQLGDGRIFVVQYLRDDAPMAQIRGYRFDLSAF